jgi:hypothetical protein
VYVILHLGVVGWGGVSVVSYDAGVVTMHVCVQLPGQGLHVRPHQRGDELVDRRSARRQKWGAREDLRIP